MRLRKLEEEIKAPRRSQELLLCFAPGCTGFHRELEEIIEDLAKSKIISGYTSYYYDTIQVKTDKGKYYCEAKIMLYEV